MLKTLLKCLPVDDGAKADVLARIGEPTRAYHGANHLADLWRRHVKHAPAANFDTPEAHRLIACAIAYHDVVYHSGRRDNESVSAETWLDVARRCGVAPGEAAWVAATIAATRDHLAYSPEPNSEPASEALRIWFLDLDLAPLGEKPATFRRNSRRLRRECPQLSDAAWADLNLAFLRKLRSAPRIFRSPVLFRAYEVNARANIAAAIARRGSP